MPMLVNKYCSTSGTIQRKDFVLRACPGDFLCKADDMRHPPCNLGNRLKYIPVKWFIAAKERQTPYPVLNLKYATRPMQASDGPGNLLVKSGLPDFIVGEQLRLEHCPVALTDQVITPRLINRRHPIQILLPALMYHPCVAGADSTYSTLREFMRLYLAGGGAQRMSQIIQRVSPQLRRNN